MQWAFIPLHAGLGAALAADMIEAARDGRLPIVEAIVRFRTLCAANAAPGHLDVAHEGLGFAARNMFADMMPAIVEAVRVASPRLLPFVWHGVGRAIYFTPSASIPAAETRCRVLDDVMSTAAADFARANTMAGFAWAVTLVNLRDPIAVEPFAVDVVSLGVERQFARGVHDALDAWRRCAPGDPAATAFASHEPRDACRRDAWMRMMRSASPRSPRHAGDLFQVEAVEYVDECGGGRG